MYIHTGVPFGSWVSMGSGGRNDEIQFGKPVVEDSKLGDILAKAPTYIGLERVIRYCLLKFAIENGAYTDAVSVDANT
ncbi:MAG TPA: hypothetical protein PKZ42_10145 [Syntrophales bacterium]|nr:hypothetical protein [Syntrophales bacterium]